MANVFTPNYNLTLIDPGAEASTWGNLSNDNLAALDAALQEVAHELRNASPLGAVEGFPFDSPPAGWVICDGRELSRTSYPELFAEIGTAFGAGDGTNTFNVPNLTDRYIRGWDNGRGVDSGRAFGSYQAGSYSSHNHSAGVGGAGGHNHTATTSTNGHHGHGGSIGYGGNHDHGGGVYGAGGHAHNFMVGVEDDGSFVTVHAAGGYNNRTHMATLPAGNHNHAAYTNATGNHTHPVGIGWDGNHSHTLSVNSVGNHSHILDVHAAGGSENRPASVTLLVCIRAR